MGELLNCPFCGGDDIFVEPDETGSGGQWVAPIHVGCKVCQCSQSDDDMDEAIAAWNRRTPQPVTPAGGEGEPVAWVVTCHSDDCEDFAQFVRDAKFVDTLRSHGLVKSVEPLYSHPPVADAALVELVKKWRDRTNYADTGDEVDTLNYCADELDAALNQRGGGCG